MSFSALKYYFSILSAFILLNVFNCIDADAQKKMPDNETNPYAKLCSAKLIITREISYGNSQPESITDIYGKYYSSGVVEKQGEAPFSGRIYYLKTIMDFKNDVTGKPYLFGQEFFDEKYVTMNRTATGTDTITTFPQNLLENNMLPNMKNITIMMRKYSDNLAMRYSPSDYMVFCVKATVESSQKRISGYTVIEFAIKEAAKEKFGDYVKFEFKTITGSKKNLKQDIILIESKLVPCVIW